MGKNKKLSAKTPRRQKHPSKASKPTGITKNTHSKGNTKAQISASTKAKPHIQHSQSAPIVPFHKTDRILLVGEGDLSFSRALVESLNCANVTATVLEGSEAELCSKYPATGEIPGAEENITILKSQGGVLRCNIDVTKKSYGSGLGKGKGERWDRVVFNFPHVGGKSKDVNRQVRYNQELLVSFFTNSYPLLSPTPGSSILVTLFEGEPYTLWNIRDLARHSGLEVVRSFRFQAGAYPGYRHARTLGVIKGKDGSLGSGWKGEDRSSRTYEFVRKGEGVQQGPGKQVESSDDEDDEINECGYGNEDDENIAEDENEEEEEDG